MNTTTSPVTGALPAAALTSGVTDLLRLAASDGLPAPHYISVSVGPRYGGIAGDAGFQFPPEPPSAKIVTRWAARFGGETQTTYQDGRHGREMWVTSGFEWNGIKVIAYAHIPVADETT